MSPTVFCKKTADTPTGRFGAATGTVTLPPELLREASRRLGWAGLIYAFGYFLAYWAPYLLSGAHPWQARIVEHIVATISIAVGIGTFVVARHTKQPPDPSCRTSS